MGNDGVEVLELRPPVERRSDTVDIGHQRRRVAGAAGADLDREIVPAGSGFFKPKTS